MPSKEHAIIIGVGPGLGAALVERCAREGLAVSAGARNAERLRALLDQRGLKDVASHACDVTDQASVDDLFGGAISVHGTPSLVVFNASGYARGSILDLTASQVEAAWRIGCLGGFHVGQAAARAMAPQGRGSLIFTGATASLRGSANFAPFAMAKFGLRALTQSLARELGPKGIHVAHTIVDGQIGDDPNDAKLRPAEIADAYWHLHRQGRSAWTQELDLRPWAEKF
jgi:NAD(P)-dependent dehydrogenase (short-subunit alcohol dehydrogenase family)